MGIINPHSPGFPMWLSECTWGGRYDELGIARIIDSYSKEVGQKSLCVIDVGCSKGVTMNDCQRVLANRGVCLETVGIDQSMKVRKKAKKNLNRFILSNIMSVERDNIYADVVICANVLKNEMPFKEKSSIVKKCASFLKMNGILILTLSSFDQFGRRPQKDELLLCESTRRRRIMQWALQSEKCLTGDLLKEIKVLNRIEAEKLAEHMKMIK